jgi:hypothetical protein
MLLFLLMMVFSNGYANNTIDDVRRNYSRAVLNSELTDQLFQQLIDSKSNDALTLAYIATFNALKAKHALNPYSKITFLNSFDNQIKSAIKRQPENLEIRFLRLSVQANIPTFLGYSSNLAEDKLKILTLIKSQKFSEKDGLFIRKIVNYMVQTNQLSVEESKAIKINCY